MSKFKEYYSNPEFRSHCLSYKKEKMTCSGCGAIVTRNSYCLHLKSKKHENNSEKNLETLKLEKKRANTEKSYDNKIKAMRQLRKLEEISINKN